MLDLSRLKLKRGSCLPDLQDLPNSGTLFRMTHSLNRIAVLGAGTMGAQIAAHLANVEIRTLLLDLPSDGPDRSLVARRALENLHKMEPRPFYTPEKARFIEVGNFEDDLSRLADCDWILEAVVEKLEVKKDLWRRVDAVRRPETIVSTNTSGLPVSRIAEGRSEDFRRHWLGTHFFNPPRYMKLLEIVPGPDTLPGLVNTVAFVGDRLLGKGIVIAKDRPNFIANRIGSFVAMKTIALMQELELTIEEVDALTGPAIGRPRTGTFRLADLVGVDVMVDVSRNLFENLPDDPWRELYRPPAFMEEMVLRDLRGRKSGQGFYKKQGDQFLALDPATLDYRPPQKPAIPSMEMARNETHPVRRIETLLAAGDKAAAFLWPFLRDTFLYSAQRVPEITDEFYQIDRAMRWGFNWDLGVFELWQALGTERVAERVEKEGGELPGWIRDVLSQPQQSFYTLGDRHELFFDLHSRQYQVLPDEPEKIRLELLRRREKVIASNPGASLIDLGDGATCLEFHSKMNAIGGDIVEMAGRALEEVEKNFLGLVVGNQGRDFSVGANLMLLLLEAQEGNWEEIDRMIRAFQHMTQSFRSCPRPVVATPFQRVLGGGVEVCMGCDAQVAAAETYMGLVEVGVGLIPAGGGTKEMLVRHTWEFRDDAADCFPGVRRAFEIIGLARVGRSAEEARRFRFLSPTDGIEVHSERLLHRAKERVLKMVGEGYSPPQPDPSVPVLGAPGLARLKVGLHLMQRAGHISDHDALIGSKLAYVLCGGDLNHPTTVPESYLMDLEREAFLSLCGERKTLERIQHTLSTGKPLRN